MATAISAARLACRLALETAERRPGEPLRRERYERALEALERLEALELAAERGTPRRVSSPDAA